MIGAIQKFSLIDYPNKIACVIFVSGCNMACPYCHNGSLVKNETKSISTNEVLDFLKQRINLLEAVVISGGEPTLYPDLISLIKVIKEMGFSVKLDTNGTNPHIIKELIDYQLINYIAMDIKGTPNKYNLITNSNINLDKINESISIIKNSNINYEFRTTIIDEFHTIDDFHIIGKLIQDSDSYYLQEYKHSKEQLSNKNFTPPSEQELIKIKQILNSYLKEVIIRK